MSKLSFARVAVVCLVAIAVSIPAEARRKKSPAASTEPGTYQKWGPDIDEIEVVKTFNAADYKTIAVVPFDTDDVQLPKPEDNTYEPVKKVLGSVTDPFVESLSEHTAAKVSLEAKPEKAAGTLIVRAKVLEMDPGSKAARYFAGFGAGAARSKISGEIVDAKTKAVLVKFTQERRSGVGMMGGDYVSLMNRNIRAIGEDVANILQVFGAATKE
jgi:hypothetical protein